MFKASEREIFCLERFRSLCQTKQKQGGFLIMAKQKRTRKALLKSPDEFLTLTGRMTNFVKEHTRVFDYAGIVVALGVVLYLGGKAYLNHVNRQGQSAYNAAYALAGDEKPDLQKVTTLFDKVTKDYGLSKVSRLVPAQVAYLRYQEKKYTDAVADYSAFLKESGKNSPYRSLAKLALASCYEEAGETAKAIDILKGLKSSPDNPFMEQTLLSLARLYRMSKQNDKAKEVYKEFIARFKTSPFMPEAKAYLDEYAS
jgi:outer membrane protein assembly factor BamD (BamD/ComL family)